MKASTSAALDASGSGVDDLSAFDLYSCFPCAVELGAEAVGLAPDDARGLTVTGGLPYFGGPGNNYSLHAVATMVDRLRHTGGTGLVTALGWYLTKHAAGIYGAEPPPSGRRHPGRGDSPPECQRLCSGINPGARRNVPESEQDMHHREARPP